MRKKLLVPLLIAVAMIIPTSTIANANTIVKNNTETRLSRPKFLGLKGYTYSRTNNTFSIDIYGGISRSSGYGMKVVSVSEINGKILVTVEFTKPNSKHDYLDVVRNLYTNVTFESSTATRVQVVTVDGSELPFLEFEI